VSEATDEIAMLRTALEFYENQLRYMGENRPAIPGDAHSPPNQHYVWSVMKDGGDIARTALGMKP
jgi:hypothetical protein